MAGHRGLDQPIDLTLACIRGPGRADQPTACVHHRPQSQRKTSSSLPSTSPSASTGANFSRRARTHFPLAPSSATSNVPWAKHGSVPLHATREKWPVSLLLPNVCSVLAQVDAKMVRPEPQRPFEGVITIHSELSPMASTEYEPGRCVTILCAPPYCTDPFLPSSPVLPMQAE